MPIQTFNFDPDGEAIRVKIDFRSTHVVSYDLMLWEAESNSVAKEWLGNNQNTQDDEYELPSPSKINDGRLLDCTLTIADPEGKEGVYKAAMILSQKNRPDLEVPATGTLHGESTLHSIYAFLKSL